jgi:GntR family transcriptional regulator, transcriptional repressor for pyruvate dehydrogenase complex
VAPSWSVADRNTLTDAVMAQIMARIRSGDFRPGTRLPAQRELASGMRVSISAVREALQRLTALGILEIHQGRPATVRLAGPQLLNRDPELFLLWAEQDTLAQVTEARWLLEMDIVELAARRATPEDLAGMLAALGCAAADEQHDYEAHRRLNNEFHLALARAAHNDILAEMLHPLLIAFRLLDASYRPDTAAHAQQLHRHIYQAIAGHDPAAARAAMLQHMQYTHEDRERAIHAIQTPGEDTHDHSPLLGSSHAR